MQDCLALYQRVSNHCITDYPRVALSPAKAHGFEDSLTFTSASDGNISGSRIEMAFPIPDGLHASVGQGLLIGSFESELLTQKS
ncbi:hypothetical protein FB106_101403 [Synechococcus sp. Ace-Pa]|nr:hypothetical protein FB106_101403 [Synechococcus sp. Ace-Pa]